MYRYVFGMEESCFMLGLQQELIAGLNCWSLGTVVFGNKYGGCEGCVADQVKGRCARCVVYPAHQVRGRKWGVLS